MCSREYEFMSTNRLCKHFQSSKIVLEGKTSECKRRLESFFICDDVFNCFDRSDESLCPEIFVSDLDNSIFTECKNGKGFICGEKIKKCIPYDAWCNTDFLKIINKDFESNINFTDCPALFKTINDFQLCANSTFWRKRSCK